MVYNVKQGDTITGIALAHSITVDQLVIWNELIKVGQVLKLTGVVPISGTVKFYLLGPGGAVADNKIVQTALNREFGGVIIDGDWGPQTSAAYARWQEIVGPTALPYDGMPGKISLPPLATKYGFTVDMAAAPGGDEPAHNYTRTTWSGRTINQRTKDMLNAVVARSGISISLTQGSYNAGGVSASAGTHDGGGVVDISSTSNTLLRAMREVGFAAWIRTPAEGFDYHMHAVAIGDREMSASAKNQVTSYFNGRNGLANNGPDTAPSSVGRPYPAWAGKYGAPI